MASVDIVKKLDELATAKCLICDGRGYTDIWPPYGGVDKERCNCDVEKQRFFRDALANSWPQISAELKAAREVCEAADRCVGPGFMEVFEGSHISIPRLEKAVVAWRKLRGTP